MTERPSLLLASDLAFIASAEDGQMCPSHFDHAAHVRLAWCYLATLPVDEASRSMCATLREFSAKAGAPEKLHITMTTAYVRLIAARERSGPWKRFALRHADLLRDGIRPLFVHYTHTRLFSDAARRTYLPPNLLPLP